MKSQLCLSNVPGKFMVKLRVRQYEIAATLQWQMGLISAFMLRPKEVTFLTSNNAFAFCYVSATSPGGPRWSQRYVCTTVQRHCKGFTFDIHATSQRSHISDLIQHFCDVAVTSPKSPWWSHGYVYTTSQRRWKGFNFNIHTTSHRRNILNLINVFVTSLQHLQEVLDEV